MRISREELARDIIFTSKNSLPSESEPLHSDQLLLHDWFELFFIKAGDVAWLIDDKMYPAPPYSLVIFNDREVHKLHVRSNKRFERMKLLFNPDLARQFEIADYDPLACFAGRTEDTGNIIQLSLHEGMALLELFEKLNKAARATTNDAPLVELVAFLDILLFANRVYQRSPEQPETPVFPDKVSDLMHYIDSHLAGDLSLETLSMVHGISRYYMCRMFKKETGSTLHNYILYKRVSGAKKLLEDGVRMARVSTMCGFGSMARFSAAFRKVAGVSPAAYAQRQIRSARGAETGDPQ